ncbi:MAG: hypothetical protein LBO67_09375, partial [Spirochaetaceae bacterium]|nr:hypothetical protein [Spirochaetaceae bacterium]
MTAVFSPIPRTSITRAIRNEQGFQMTSGMTDPDTIAALGKQLGAKYVVAGAITNLGTHNLLVISILHTEDLRQIAGDIQTYRNIEEIKDKLPSMARTIAAALKRDTAYLPLLAIPPVEWSDKVGNREADALAQILAVHLVRSGRYAVYPRTKSLEQVQREYNNQFNGDTADEYLPAIGKATNPRLVLSVSARKLGSATMFNAAIINLETGVQEAGGTADYQTLDDGIRAMGELAMKLTGDRILPIWVEEQDSGSAAATEQREQDRPSAAATVKAEQERATAQAALVKAEQERLAAERAAAQAEEERKAAQALLAKAEQERKNAEAALAKAEQERKNAEAALAKAGQERKNAQAALVKAEQERLAAERAAAQAEEERKAAQAATEPKEQARPRVAAGKQFVINERAAFIEAITAINADSAGGTYTITLNGNFYSTPVVFFQPDAPKTIILKGDGTARTITNNGESALFTVPKG